MREENCEVGRGQQWRGWKAEARSSRERVLRGRKKGRWEEQWGWRAEVPHSRPETHGVREHKRPPLGKLQKTTSFQVNGGKKGWGLWGSSWTTESSSLQCSGKAGVGVELDEVRVCTKQFGWRRRLRCKHYFAQPKLWPILLSSTKIRH